MQSDYLPLAVSLSCLQLRMVSASLSIQALALESLALSMADFGHSLALLEHRTVPTKKHLRLICTTREATSMRGA